MGCYCCALLLRVDGFVLSVCCCWLHAVSLCLWLVCVGCVLVVCVCWIVVWRVRLRLSACALLVALCCLICDGVVSCVLCVGWYVFCG